MPKTPRSSVVSTSVGVGLAVGLYGTSFGALAVAAGLSIAQTQVLSLLMFSGGSQFAVAGVIAASGPAGIVPAILSAWLLGIRNGFYALRLNGVLGVTGMLKLVASQLTIDESNAVSASQENAQDSKRGFWITGIAVFVFWNLFTFIGAFLGAKAGKPEVWGLDAAAAAAFLGLVWPRLKSLQSNVIALLAAAITLALVPVLPSGIPVIVGAPIAVGLVYIAKNMPWGARLKEADNA